MLAKEFVKSGRWEELCKEFGKRVPKREGEPQELCPEERTIWGLLLPINIKRAVIALDAGSFQGVAVVDLLGFLLHGAKDYLSAVCFDFFHS